MVTQISKYDGWIRPTQNLDICLLEHPAIKLRLILAILINNNSELHQISKIQELIRILGYAIL